MDLHGLHVAEAVETVKALLDVHREAQKASRFYPYRYLTVITGRGRHSVGGVAKIKPAIENLLRINGYEFEVLQAGCLRVNLWQNV